MPKNSVWISLKWTRQFFPMDITIMEVGWLPFWRQIKKQTYISRKKALGEFYAHDPDGSNSYIGLPVQWKDNPRVICHTGDYRLDTELQVFAGVTGRECYSPANDSLYASMNGRHVPDLFMHEQNLLIRERNKVVLLPAVRTMEW